MTKYLMHTILIRHPAHIRYKKTAHYQKIKLKISIHFLQTFCVQLNNYYQILKLRLLSFVSDLSNQQKKRKIKFKRLLHFIN